MSWYIWCMDMKWIQMRRDICRNGDEDGRWLIHDALTLRRLSIFVVGRHSTDAVKDLVGGSMSGLSALKSQTRHLRVSLTGARCPKEWSTERREVYTIDCRRVVAPTSDGGASVMVVVLVKGEWRPVTVTRLKLKITAT